MNVAGGSIADQIDIARRGVVMTGLFACIFLGPVIGSAKFLSISLLERANLIL